jgi:hypothetical protein
MESKTTRHKIIKSTVTKNDTPAEKLVLKPETVVEVKSNKAKKTNTTNVVELKQETKVQPAEVQVAGKSVKATTKSTKSVEPVVETAKVVEPVKSTKTAKSVETAKVVEPVKVTKTTKTTKSVEPVEVVKAEVVKAKVSKVTKAKVENKETGVKSLKSKKIVTVDTVENDDNEDNEETGSGKLRYFKLYYNNDICGRYCGKKPKQAANKAFSSIIKEMKKTDKKEGTNVDISFSIRECTRNSSHKEYNYVGKRLVLSNPVKVQIENEDGTTKEIVYKFHNELKKAPKAPKV